MQSRERFARSLSKLPLTTTDRAVALLWFYRYTQEYEERTAAELAADLHELGFSRPPTTRLKRALSASHSVIRGKRSQTYRINVRKLEDLDARYAPLLNLPAASTSDSILRLDGFPKSRGYLLRLAQEINGTYDAKFYNSCAVLCRRLMETLLIEIFITKSREGEIKDSQGRFVALERIIGVVTSSNTFNLSRGTLQALPLVKELGDTAAHDRSYMVLRDDIDPLRLKYRKLIGELLGAALTTT